MSIKYTFEFSQNPNLNTDELIEFNRLQTYYESKINFQQLENEQMRQKLDLSVSLEVCIKKIEDLNNELVSNLQTFYNKLDVNLFNERKKHDEEITELKAQNAFRMNQEKNKIKDQIKQGTTRREKLTSLQLHSYEDLSVYYLDLVQKLEKKLEQKNKTIKVLKIELETYKTMELKMNNLNKNLSGIIFRLNEINKNMPSKIANKQLNTESQVKLIKQSAESQKIRKEIQLRTQINTSRDDYNLFQKPNFNFVYKNTNCFSHKANFSLSSFKDIKGHYHHNRGSTLADSRMFNNLNTYGDLPESNPKDKDFNRIRKIYSMIGKKIGSKVKLVEKSK